MALHRNAHTLLEGVAVVNPFADTLTFLDDKTHTRRDHMKYLTLIRMVALLHQHQRPIRTVENREASLRPFIAWAHQRGLTRPQEITKPIMERYYRPLFLYRKADGEPRSTRSLHVREVEAVLAVPDLSTPTGIRDRAIMEVLHSTASGAWNE